MQGVARDAPVAAGMVTGLRLGFPLAAAAAPALGPFAAGIPVVTTLAGAGAGLLFGSELDRWFPAVPREDLVPYREGGKTFGSAIGSAPAAFGLPQMTGNRVSRFLSTFGETARRNPATFMATEAVTGASMGVAGGGAESYFPGQQGVRFGAELGAAILTPTKLLLAGVDAASQGLKAIRSGVSGNQDRAQTKAANVLLDALEKNQEDPAALILALRSQLPRGVAPTSAQRTGSQTLMDLEASLGKANPQLGGQISKQGREALEAYELLIENLQASGNPEALRIAAQLRENKFNATLDNRLATADANAAAKIALITKDTPAARRQIGDIVKTETELALNQARMAERELWSDAINQMLRPVLATRRIRQQIPDDFMGRPQFRSWDETRLVTPSLKPSNTAQSFMARASEIGDLIYDEALPSTVRKIMDGFGLDQAAVQKYKMGRNTQEFLETGVVPKSFVPTPKDIPIGELVNYRSNLLEAARNDPANSELYARLANSILDDLSSVKNPVFDKARSFSKALNDTFTRTFAKTASITGDVARGGAERLPAEILVSRAFGSNADVTMQRMEQVEDAVRFMRRQYDEAVAKDAQSLGFGKRSEYSKFLKPMAELADTNLVSIQDAHQRVLRLLAANVIETKFDPAKNANVRSLNQTKLERFKSENGEMLKKLGIMDDLENATQAQNLLLMVEKQNNVMDNTIRGQTAFAKVLTSENPTLVIGDILNSRNPVKGFTQVAKLAAAGGPDALNGLKSSVLDYAYAKAGGLSNRFSITAYKDALFEPLSRTQPSIINMLRASGAMSLTEVKDILRLVQPMSKIETAMKNGIPITNLIEGADALTDLALRVVGSNIGTAAASGGSGSLIAASAGSKAVRQIFDALPNATIRQVLENASKDPEMMALLLEKGKTAKQQTAIYNKLLDKLGAMGISVGKSAVTPALNYLAPEEPRPQQLRGATQPPQTPEGQAARQLRRLPPAPGTRGVPGFGQQSSAAPAGGGGAPATDSRAMFQQLFPFDSIGAMAAQPAPQPPQG
jgi:hypothetical protein